MKKFLLILFLTATILYPVFSANAVIKEISGKVEIKEDGGSWTPAVNGMTITEGTVISTGFRSKAVLDLGSSILEIKPLTRMSLEALIEKEGTVTTNLYLRVGRVDANVKRDTGLNHDFKLRSAVSTAAVRGTKFSYTGTELIVTEGVVNLFNQLNQRASAQANQSITVDKYSIVDAQSGMNGNFRVQSDTGNSAPESSGNSLYTDIVITITEAD